MLPPNYFDYATDDLLELYSKLDETITRDIVRRLVKTGGVSATADWQIQRLQESGVLLEDIIHRVAQLTDASDQQVKALFEDAGVQAVEIDRDIYQAAGLSPPPLHQSSGAMQILQAGMQKTAGHLRNLSMTTAVSTQQSYINAVTLAEMQVESGAFDYVTAIRNAVRSAAESGAEVLYPTGHRDKLDVAIRRATLTGVSQTAAQISERYADDTGCDLVETTAHPGARPDHAVWQGRVFSRSGGHSKYPDFVKTTGYGTGAGLCGWNCRHSFFPFFEGISPSAYPREKLQEYENQTVQYDGEFIKYYDAAQMQRAMERQIRATKRELAGYDAGIKSTDNEQLQNALNEQFQATSVKLSRQKSQLDDFIGQTGLLRQGEREQVLGYGHSQAQKAVWANKKAITSFANEHISSVDIVTAQLNKSPEYGIMKFTKREEANELFRPDTEKLWGRLDKGEKRAAFLYTRDSNPFNRPLRGYNKSWDDFIGIGKVSFDNEGAEEMIRDLKSAIDKSAISKNVWLFRGSDQQSLASLLGIEKGKVIPSNLKALNRKFSGTNVMDPGFFSTGISSDSGFSGQVNYEIFAPKGTKGIYTEPFSAFGGTNTEGNWDGKERGSFVGSEAEMLLQAGTVFTIREIKIVAEKITVVLEVV